MVAQLFQLTAAERKTLLVAGAAAGMSATFSAPLASVLLAVELLLFRIEAAKPRSRVALASATALFVRLPLLGSQASFFRPLVTPQRSGSLGSEERLRSDCSQGALAALLSLSVYASGKICSRSSLFTGCGGPQSAGVVVGLGGLICPRALGVGYDTIDALLERKACRTMTWSCWLS